MWFMKLKYQNQDSRAVLNIAIFMRNTSTILYSCYGDIIVYYIVSNIELDNAFPLFDLPLSIIARY